VAASGRSTTKAGGFGSKLVQRSVATAGGTIHHDWAEGGLIVTIDLDRAKLSR
jgi:two-component sensor histidine kinase